MPSSVNFETRLDSLKVRKSLTDDIWVLTLMSAIVAIGVPWFQRVLDIRLGPIAWTAFGYSCAYVAISYAAEQTLSRRWFLTATVCLQVTGVLILGVLWRFAGALQNPMFLLVFTMPVLAGSILLPRWHAFLAASLAVATVCGVAVFESPELRWYSQQLGIPLDSLFRLLAGIRVASPAAVRPFPGLTDPPAYLAVLLFLFSVLLFLVAGAGRIVGGAVMRFQERVFSMTETLANNANLQLEIVHVAMSPTVLVDTDSFRVIHASESFLKQFFIEGDKLGEPSLFDLVKFSYPDVVETLIRGSGGTVPRASILVQGEQRLLNARVTHLLHAGRQCAYVSLRDVTDEEYLRLALNVFSEPCVVIDTSQRVRFFNAAGKHALKSLEPGIPATSALRASNTPLDWWDLGHRPRQECHVVIDGRSFKAVCSASSIEGETAFLTTVLFYPERVEGA